MATVKVSHRVLFGDTDALGIVYYGNYFRYFEIGRAEWFRQFMKPFTHYVEQDYYLIVLESFCKHRKPARYDDVIEIESWATDIKLISFAFEYVIRHSETKEILVEGYTLHTTTGKDGKLRRFTREFLAELKALAEPSLLAKPKRRPTFNEKHEDSTS